jgi:hypothetical protein
MSEIFSARAQPEATTRNSKTASLIRGRTFERLVDTGLRRKLLVARILYQPAPEQYCRWDQMLDLKSAVGSRFGYTLRRPMGGAGTGLGGAIHDVIR